MTELSLRTAYSSNAPTEQTGSKSTSRLKRCSIALLLGLLVPGLGQVYTKRPWRGLALTVVLALLLVLAGEMRLFVTLVGLVVSLFVSVLIRLWIIVDGCVLAWRDPAPDARSGNRTAEYVVSIVLISMLGAYPFPDVWLKYFAHFRAFSVPSGSMCPTICIGDRIVVATDAYRSRQPQRGELVAFHFQGQDTTYLKRVIATQGDQVRFGESVPISINGIALELPKPCGGPQAETLWPREGGSPEVVTVPASSFFVVGDNLNNSYDSRIEGFGFATPRQLVGKPAFVYWSSDHSRIGCELH